MQVTLKSFKLHPGWYETSDAALKKRGSSGTTVETAALEFICLDYLAGNAKPINQQLRGLGPEEAAEMFAKVFPEAGSLGTSGDETQTVKRG